MAQDTQQSGTIERTVKIKRCAAVVKGGRRFSFAAMVVCGDGDGKVGWGYGKANEVQPSVEKATKQAMRSMVKVPIVEGAIPHRVDGQYGAAKVVLLPSRSRYRYHRRCGRSCGLRSMWYRQHSDQKLRQQQSCHAGQGNDRRPDTLANQRRYREPTGSPTVNIHDVHEGIVKYKKRKRTWSWYRFWPW